MNNNEKKYDYGKCHVCGEQMQETRINQTFWVRSPRVNRGPQRGNCNWVAVKDASRLVVIEAVPAGVCPQCGEKIVKAKVGRQLANLIGNVSRLSRRKTITVPVINYAKEAA
jgi:ssDNA-binding Zn-finger/Zn-ribbon topoisomerase 1